MENNRLSSKIGRHDPNANQKIVESNFGPLINQQPTNRPKKCDDVCNSTQTLNMTYTLSGSNQKESLSKPLTERNYTGTAVKAAVSQSEHKVVHSVDVSGILDGKQSLGDPVMIKIADLNNANTDEGEKSKKILDQTIQQQRGTLFNDGGDAIVGPQNPCKSSPLENIISDNVMVATTSMLLKSRLLKPYHCYVCKTWCISMGNLKRHYKSKTHRMMVDKDMRRLSALVATCKASLNGRYNIQQQSLTELQSLLYPGPNGIQEMTAPVVHHPMSGSVGKFQISPNKSTVPITSPMVMNKTTEVVGKDIQTAESNMAPIIKYETKDMKENKYKLTHAISQPSLQTPDRKNRPQEEQQQRILAATIKLMRGASTSTASIFNDGPTICFACNKIFTRSCYLAQHNQAHHNGEKPFKCTGCGKRFSSKDVYQKHVASHDSDKPFKCEICPKQFNYKVDLVRHLCSHTGKKPHACGTCGKGYIRKDHMEKHAKKHLHYYAPERAQLGTYLREQ